MLFSDKPLRSFFAEDKQQRYCGDLVLGWAVLQDCLQPLVNWNSIKALEKY